MSAIADGVAALCCTAASPWRCASAFPASPGPGAPAGAGAACLGGGSQESDSTAMSCEMYLS